jgi:hypothetical protein
MLKRVIKVERVGNVEKSWERVLNNPLSFDSSPQEERLSSIRALVLIL